MRARGPRCQPPHGTRVTCLVTPGQAEEGDLDPVVLGQALLRAGTTGPGSTVDPLRALLNSTRLATDLTLCLVDYQLNAVLPVAPRAGALLRTGPVDGLASASALATTGSRPRRRPPQPALQLVP